MTPALIVHVAAGGVGILAGAAALCVRKGARAHRVFGTVFFGAMLIMAAMGAALATQIPQRGTVAVGVLTLYFVATAWMAVRRAPNTVGPFDTVALFVAAAVAVALLVFGVQAATSPTGLLDAAPPARYYAFAAFAAFVAFGDFRMIRRGGIAGAPRIARHLWRMCFALFFAASSFFIGQQKVMPATWHGSPILYALALAPLVAMIGWLIRVRVGQRWRGADAMHPRINQPCPKL